MSQITECQTSSESIGHRFIGRHQNDRHEENRVNGTGRRNFSTGYHLSKNKKKCRKKQAGILRYLEIDAELRCLEEFRLASVHKSNYFHNYNVSTKNPLNPNQNRCSRNGDTN